MSGRLTIPKIFMAGGAVGFTYYMFMRQYWFPNPYKTREVQNIEDRFTAGGGTPYSTPAAGTPRGDPKDTTLRQTSEHKGPQTDHFKENFSSQKNTSVWPDKFYETHSGNAKGK
ncbi:uncharacterized protein CC84DRAFT_1102093 [Paraphaeosphaeria sporulosa]|uniref:Uncharacterized protein n=1 Tax=Paraphaeosphaeria sporulosa TaxID=1460663 RepID=A0A177C0Z3_9PLEO|nr:uncharacterized protein CC84DRAFT_1102093 [Paraphaeosphaeria sporulosa]OAG00387.1 hypothetical protein CC84DRAFT_1102093 [Paraphaeosphaeria sporulosa]